jgi:hypothetical protein
LKYKHKAVADDGALPKYSFFVGFHHISVAALLFSIFIGNSRSQQVNEMKVNK